ncbi:hypothetical protein [Paenibacillus cymbidii]|uniref:hypothetical protein n=1 Tax=Paenibacillus cymbidii TaxID=1639034 RepID=UPI0010804893|nr:hypothetical protein [Paenibacillus cymbidii]
MSGMGEATLLAVFAGQHCNWKENHLLCRKSKKASLHVSPLKFAVRDQLGANPEKGTVRQLQHTLDDAGKQAQGNQ